MKLLTLLLTLAVTSSVYAVEVKSDIWRGELKSCIRHYDENGKVEIENGTYIYRYHTLIYKFHPITTKAGDTSGETYNQEGPKDDGIFLQASIREGVYNGQLEIPQEMKFPFWNTFFNAYPIDTGRYFWVSISYGKNSNMKFVNDLKTCFGLDVPPILKPISENTTPRFGLYLVTKNAILERSPLPTELDKMVLEKSPLLTEDDIIDYNWTNHTMYITETAAKRIPKVDSFGKPFVIVADGKSIYYGAFWTSLSSAGTQYPIIDTLLAEPKTTLKIERRYPDWPSKGELDPRNNEAIKKVFRELGKLTEK
jgi:hypothetical protein